MLEERILVVEAWRGQSIFQGCGITVSELFDTVQMVACAKFG